MKSPAAESRLPSRAVTVTAAVTLLLLLPVPLSLADLGRGDLLAIGKDKIAHFLLFVPLAWVWLVAMGQRGSGRAPRDSSTFSWAGGAALFALLVAWGGAIELVQGWSGWRRGEWSDLVADAVGVLVGFALHAWRRPSSGPGAVAR